LCNTSMSTTNMDIFMTKHGLDASNIKKIMNKKKNKPKEDSKNNESKSIGQIIKGFFGLNK